MQLLGVVGSVDEVLRLPHFHRRNLDSARSEPLIDGPLEETAYAIATGSGSFDEPGVDVLLSQRPKLDLTVVEPGQKLHGDPQGVPKSVGRAGTGPATTAVCPTARPVYQMPLRVGAYERRVVCVARRQKHVEPRKDPVEILIGPVR